MKLIFILFVLLYNINAKAGELENLFLDPSKYIELMERHGLRSQSNTMTREDYEAWKLEGTKPKSQQHNEGT